MTRHGSLAAHWGWQLLAGVIRAMVILPLVALLLLGVAWALLHGEWATSVLVSHLPADVKVVGARGSLLGDFSADRLDVRLPRGGRVHLVAPSWQRLRVRWDAQADWHIGLVADSLTAQRLDVNWVSDPSSPVTHQPPPDVGLPLSIDVTRVQVAEAYSPWWGSSPLTHVDGAVVLGGSGLHEVHCVKLTRLDWAGWQWQGQASLGTRARLPLQADVRVQGVPTPGVQGAGQFQVSGSLGDLRAKGALTWHSAQRPTQSLLVDGQVQPFAAWPVSRLDVQAKGLNLQDVHASLPLTALSGQWLIEPMPGQNLRARIKLDNDQDGAWDAQRLPLRRMEGTVLLAQPMQIASLDALWPALSVDLRAQVSSLGERPPAEVSLQGQWRDDKPLVLAFTGLEPQALHATAPALRLQGRVSVQAQGGAAARQAGWPTWPALLTASVTGQYGAPFARPERARQLGSALRQVSLALRAQKRTSQIDVQQLELTADDAQASLHDAVWAWSDAQGAVPWRSSGQLTVQRFDPQVWLPWPVSMSGRNQVSGQLRFDVNAAWRGTAQLQLAPSVLAGIPLSGQMQWRSPVQQAVMALSVDVDAGGNQVQAQADLPWVGSPAGAFRLLPDATWQASVNAQTLQTLQPLAPLLGLKQLNGAVSARLTGAGWWPQLHTSGEAQVQKLALLPLADHAGGMTLASAHARWQVDTRMPDAPMQVHLDVAQALAGGVQLDQAVVQLSGTARSHELSAQVAGHKLGKATGANTSVAKSETMKAALQMQGGLQSQGNIKSWRGQIKDLLVQMGETKPRTVLQVPATQLVWQQEGLSERLSVSPVGIQVSGAQLKLQALNWFWPDRSQDAVGEGELSAQLEPFNLPAVLARWQPQAGWGGDLMLTGHIQVRHSLRAPWTVAAEVSRQSGDITLSEPTIEGNSSQPLGIQSMRLGMQAHDGVWTLTEHFEGRVMGLLSGQQTVRTHDASQLPQGSDPLSGDLLVQIGSLRPWGTWVPAGWRLSGQLQGQIQLGGTLAAPQYKGQVQGQKLGLGHALMGVNLSDGQLQMSLDGDQIKLTQLLARGGAKGGQISVTGDAVLGEEPQAHLTLKAEQFALLQRVDRRVVISGELQTWLGQEDIRAVGQIGVDEGLIDISRSDVPTIGEDVNVTHRPGEDAPSDDDAAQSAGGNGGSTAVKRKVTASLDVDLGHKLRLKGRGLDAILTGVLKVTTPGNKPALHGTVRVEKGTYAAYGQKLVIERGSIAFTGAIENPRLDILAMRPQSVTATASDVKVGVAIGGTAMDPRVTLYSDTDMSETEKLSWLVLGRAPSGLGGADIGLLQSAAVALLAGEGSSAPSDNLIGLLGLDELSVKQTDTTVRETVVNVGKQVSKLWYVGYERNLNATGGNWQLIYRLAQRLTVRAQAGEDNAVDFIWSWRWD